MKSILFSILSFFAISSFAQNQFPTSGSNQTAIIDGTLPYNGKLNLINNSRIILESGSDIVMNQGAMLFSTDVFVNPIDINQAYVRLKNGFTDFHMNPGGISGLNFGFAVYKNNLSEYPSLNPISGIGFINSDVSSKRLYLTHGATPWNSTLGINILPNGDIGIGIINPSTRLHIVSGVTNNSGLRLANLTSSSPSTSGAKAIGVTSTGQVVTIDVEGGSSSDRAWLTTGNNETTAPTSTYGNDVNNNFLGTTNEEDLVIATYNKERLRISTTGRLTFHNNDISPNAVNNLYLGGGNEIPIGLNNYGNTAIGLGSLNALNTNGKKNTALGSNALRLISSGENNIGIGYNSGGNITTGSNNIIIGGEIIAPLSSSINNQLNIGNWIFGYDGVIAIGDFDDLPSAFEFNTLEGYQLLVKNGIRTEKVRVDISDLNNWADYVFDNDYELLSIEDLAYFIETYKHLPNIPSAEEVKRDGIDLAEMDAKLLEKIEELTLYNIDLYNENKSLKEENEQQQKLLDELIRRVEKLESSK